MSALSPSPSGPASPRPRRRRRFLLLTGVAAAGLCLAGTGVASATSVDMMEVLGITETDPSMWPADYTMEQYIAFWGAGYTVEDAAALNELWSSDWMETKARAGQLLIDGQEVPIPPSGVPGGETTEPPPPADPVAEQQMPLVQAFFAAGYSYEDAEALGELWSTEVWEAKARGGQLVLDGEALPVAPSGTPWTVEPDGTDQTAGDA